MSPYQLRILRKSKRVGQAALAALSNRPLSGLSAFCLLITVGLICINSMGCGSSSAAKASPVLTTRSPIETERKYDDPPLSDRELSGMLETQVTPIPANPPLHTPIPTPSQETSKTPVGTSTDRNSEPALTDRRPPGNMVSGYRVQIHSFRGRASAIKAQRQVKDRVKEFRIEVHLEEEASYYKIRVGDFTSKSDADRLARILKTQKGYPDAWVVKTSVYASGR
jgi:cell division septation protein DedD